MLAGAVTAVWWWSVGVDLEPWRSGAPPRTWAAWRRQEERWRAEGLSRRPLHQFVPLHATSPELVLAVAVSEDARFLDHVAIDVGALREALWEWPRRGKLRGASTIGQQLARLLFLNQERTLLRKLKEWKLAWWLERKLGKRRVLELYLNVVEFGPGVFGAEAASRRYFGVSAACLDPLQAAGLAASVPAPGVDNPASASPRWQRRRQSIAARAARASILRQRLAALVGPVEPCPLQGDAGRSTQ